MLWITILVLWIAWLFCLDCLVLQFELPTCNNTKQKSPFFLCKNVVMEHPELTTNFFCCKTGNSNCSFRQSKLYNHAIQNTNTVIQRILEPYRLKKQLVFFAWKTVIQMRVNKEVRTEKLQMSFLIYHRASSHHSFFCLDNWNSIYSLIHVVFIMPILWGTVHYCGWKTHSKCTCSSSLDVARVLIATFSTSLTLL